jgi:branched-chain amino acid transport system permease protein
MNISDILHRLTRLRRVEKLALFVLWLLVPILLSSWDYGLHIAISVTLWAVLALGINLVNGQAGQLILGGAAWFAIGAYASALLMLFQGWSFWATLPVSFFLGALSGFLVGLPSIRVGGDYLGIVTLGFGEIARLILINWASLTRGPMGLPGIPAPSVFGTELSSKAAFFYLLTALLVGTWILMNRLTVSKFGLQLLSLREDARVAQALGVDIGRAKVTSFVISAAVIGLAGAFYGSYISFISPDAFVFNDSMLMLAMVILGGMGSPGGSVLGAVILIVAPEALRFLGDWRIVLYGLLLTVMMVYRPSGLWGLERRPRNEIKLTVKR